jgi:hypothetical protein
MTSVTAIGLRVNTFGGDRLFTTRSVDGMARPARHLSIGNNSSQRHAQASPSKHCRSVGAVGRKSNHRDPRCSLDCRRNWAWKESMILARHFESLPGHVAKFAGTLNVFGVVELGDFLAIYRAFQKGIRKRFGESVQLRPVTEIGPRCGRFHVHYTMTSDGMEVTKAEILEVWRDACGNRRIQVDHKPIEDVSTWARYMFKTEWKYYEPGNPDCVVLFAKGSPRLPQATRDFLPAKVKAALWDEWIAERHPASKSERCLTSEKDWGKTRERLGVSEGTGLSGTAVPRTSVGIIVGKTTVKNRPTGQFRAAWIRSERRLSHRNQGIGGHSRVHRGDIRANVGKRPVSDRPYGEGRSIALMPEVSSGRILGRLVRAP